MSRADKREIRNIKRLKRNRVFRKLFMFIFVINIIICIFTIDKSGKEMLGYENYKFNDFIESFNKSLH